MPSAVLLDVKDGIALLTLNRPERLNALNYDLIGRLMAALDDIEIDAGIRAVILTGAGERAFSAGADIHEFSTSVRHGANTALRDFVRRGQAMTARLEAFKKPVIAAVNGLAGRKRALEYLLTGDPFSPAQALEAGLVNAIVPHDELLPAARRLAGRIMRHSPLAVGSVITAVTRGLNMAIAEGLQVESEQFAALVPSHDLGEGLTAWIERRAPNYNGR